jgi:hypothetical protein
MQSDGHIIFGVVGREQSVGLGRQSKAGTCWREALVVSRRYDGAIYGGLGKMVVPYDESAMPREQINMIANNDDGDRAR